MLPARCDYMAASYGLLALFGIALLQLIDLPELNMPTQYYVMFRLPERHFAIKS